MEHLLIFDTNSLFVNYDKNCNFTDFSFSGTFENFVRKIEELDIYDLVSIAIPKVVWTEMKKQNLSAYEKKANEFERSISKNRFPFHMYQIDKTKNYEEYLDTKINEYKEILKNKLITIEEIDFPSDKCYNNLIKRAFEKRPPFEGQDKASDKGFKDALLWESILEYKRTHDKLNIILYTNDKMFNTELQEEYKQLFDKQEITFINSTNETILNEKLSEIAKTKDNTYPTSFENSLTPENKESLEKYLFSDSEDVTKAIQVFSKDIIGETPYLKLEKVQMQEILQVELTTETDSDFIYEVQALVNLTLSGPQDLTFSDTKTLYIMFFSDKHTNTFSIASVDVIRDEG